MRISRRTQFAKQCGANDSFILFLAAGGEVETAIFLLLLLFLERNIFHTNQQKSEGDYKYQYTAVPEFKLFFFFLLRGL